MRNTIITILVLGFSSAVIVACSPQNSSEGKQQSPIVLKPDNQGYSIPESLKSVRIAEPSNEFAAFVVTPYSRGDFKIKSDYETLEEYKVRYADYIKDAGASQETPSVIYHDLGPLVGKGPNGETGAVKLSYSVEDKTATFNYNPGRLQRQVWMGIPAPKHPNQWTAHSLTIRDIDCIATEPLDLSDRKLYLERRREVVPMDRETAEQLEVLSKPKLLAVARIEYDLSDPRYTSVPVLNRLAIDPVVHKKNIERDGTDLAQLHNFGPTQTVVTALTFDSGIGTPTYTTHIGDVTDVLVIDVESKNVLYKLPGCSPDSE